MTLISIITPTYRAEKTIARAVKSVMAQMHSDWEMIIVSDDAQDYRAILANNHIVDSRLRFATTGQMQSGPSRGRNVALDMAQGEFITTLDADDEYHPDYLARMLAVASIYGIAMMLVTHKIKADGSKQLLLSPVANSKKGYALSTLDEYLKSNGCSVTMFSRRFLKHRYLETTNYGEDFHFDVRFYEYVDVIPVFYDELYMYHHNEASLTNARKADELFISDYQKMITIIEADETISPQLKNSLLAAHHYRLFQNYMYVNAKQKGECADFYEFMAQHPEYFR